MWSNDVGVENDTAGSIIYKHVLANSLSQKLLP